MGRTLPIFALALASLFTQPALAESTGHQHGQEAAGAPRADAPDALDDMKSGGKSCKKCKKGGGHDHGGATGDQDDGGDGALAERVRQLEKRLDLMQTMLEMLAERRGGGGSGAGGGGGGGHAGHH
ncbi:MAG: hypothetical protein AB1899_08250 [Pseudomonadota bacterium]